jgi:hypothetical protein
MEYDRTNRREARSRKVGAAERTADGPEANRLERSDSRIAGSPAGGIDVSSLARSYATVLGMCAAA